MTGGRPTKDGREGKRGGMRKTMWSEYYMVASLYMFLTEMGNFTHLHNI